MSDAPTLPVSVGKFYVRTVDANVVYVYDVKDYEVRLIIVGPMLSKEASTTVSGVMRTKQSFPNMKVEILRWTPESGHGSLFAGYHLFEDKSLLRRLLQGAESVCDEGGLIAESIKSELVEFPDIITFCESPKYLNMAAKGCKLYPMQRAILKSFYRGDGNNSLNNDDIHLLCKNRLYNVLDKCLSTERFRELVLVLGRRGGKDLIGCIILCYELARLLDLTNGDPYKFYGLSSGNPIYLLSVSVSADQARILFNQIKIMVMSSEHFRNRIGHVAADKIHFLTDADRARRQELVDSGESAAADRIKGSVVVSFAHANSEALLGKRYFCLIMNEVASFKNTGGATSGDRIYSALGPATADFKRIVGYADPTEEGAAAEPIREVDSKIISISSPRDDQGIFYRLYSEADMIPSRLAFKLPTWKVNEMMTEPSLRAENKFMKPEEFAMEFGAEFSLTQKPPLTNALGATDTDPMGRRYVQFTQSPQVAREKYGYSVYHEVEKGDLASLSALQSAKVCTLWCQSMYSDIVISKSENGTEVLVPVFECDDVEAEKKKLADYLCARRCGRPTKVMIHVLKREDKYGLVGYVINTKDEE